MALRDPKVPKVIRAMQVRQAPTGSPDPWDPRAHRERPDLLAVFLAGR